VSVRRPNSLEDMVFPLENGRLFSAGDCAAERAAVNGGAGPDGRAEKASNVSGSLPLLPFGFCRVDCRPYILGAGLFSELAESEHWNAWGYIDEIA
jgi:hypothetical protein